MSASHNTVTRVLSHHYDAEADAFYVTFRKAPIASQVTLSPEIILDETVDHTIVGMEVLYPRENWPQAQKWLRQHGFLVDFPLSSFDVTPSNNTDQ
ncbi:DUF2283 domain-containing protein [Sulfobacillus thermosulfidooxidans]|uniref:DUF2283 domain-containing protein n=1 Tax=Sulfobacillus thermosulfidooxidans TaxID=28034 RepID=UPI0006B40E5D|nr:DUF2283 domain-containing protein [Sulfobacillus thermosulfidooxidans]